MKLPLSAVHGLGSEATVLHRVSADGRANLFAFVFT